MFIEIQTTILEQIVRGCVFFKATFCQFASLYLVNATQISIKPVEMDDIGAAALKVSST